MTGQGSKTIFLFPSMQDDIKFSIPSGQRALLESQLSDVDSAEEEMLAPRFVQRKFWRGNAKERMLT